MRKNRKNLPTGASVTTTRMCMFCDSRASTREDAWPLWLVRMFPGSVEVSVEAEREGNVLKPWRQCGHFAKVKFACGPCNNGWMSDLENEAKPIILSLLSNDVAAGNFDER